MTFTAVLNVKPHGKGRPRFGNGRTYTDAKTVAAEEAIRFQLRQLETLPMFEGPLRVDVFFFLKRPKSAPKRTHPTVRYDIDNLIKLLLDACNGLLWADDCQVCAITASKRYDVKEWIRIAVEEMPA